MVSLTKDTLVGIGLTHIERLNCFPLIQHDPSLQDYIKNLLINTLQHQPWYFRIPIRCLAFASGSICFFMTLKKLPRLSIHQRNILLRRLRFFPFFFLLNTFIENIVLFNIFDHPKLSSEIPHFGI